MGKGEKKAYSETQLRAELEQLKTRREELARIFTTAHIHVESPVGALAYATQQPTRPSPRPKPPHKKINATHIFGDAKEAKRLNLAAKKELVWVTRRMAKLLIALGEVAPNGDSLDRHIHSFFADEAAE